MSMNQAGPPAEPKKESGLFFRLLVFFLSILAGLATATQHFAWTMQYHASLGPQVTDGIYWPWKFVTWALAWHTYPQFERPLMISSSFGIAVIAVFFLIYTIVRILQQNTGKANRSLHGSARWADEKDIERAALFQQEGVFVGAYKDKKGRTRYLIHNGPEHVLTYAPTRSGKGVGLVIPTLLFWRWSTVVSDLKGELWAITAGWRKAFAKNICIKFEPASPKDSAHWNPLDEVRLDAVQRKKNEQWNKENPDNPRSLDYQTGYEVGDVQNIANLIVDPDGKGLNDHWQKTSNALLVGCILHLLYKREQEGTEATMSALDAMLADPERSLSELWKEMTTYPHLNGETNPTVARAAQDMIDRPENEGGSVLSTAKSYLALYRDPVVQKNTSESNFCIHDLMNSEQPVSLYIVTQPADKARLRSLVRLLVTMIIRVQASDMEFVESEAKEYSTIQKIWRKMRGLSTAPVGGGRSAKGRYKWRQLLMLDEFSSLGKLEILQEALAFIAGYGMKAYLICQDLMQLKSEETGYGRNETITSNCHIQNCYPPNNLETAKYVSEMTGQATAWKEQITTSGKRAGIFMGQVSKVMQEIQRPLLTPDEALRLEGPKKDASGMITQAGHMIVFTSGSPAIYGVQPLFFKDETFVKRSCVAPPETSDIIRKVKRTKVSLDEGQKTGTGD